MNKNDELLKNLKVNLKLNSPEKTLTARELIVMSNLWPSTGYNNAIEQLLEMSRLHDLPEDIGIKPTGTYEYNGSVYTEYSLTLKGFILLNCHVNGIKNKDIILEYYR